MSPESATPPRDDFAVEDIHRVAAKYAADAVTLMHQNRNLRRCLWYACAVATVGWCGVWLLLVTR